MNTQNGIAAIIPANNDLDIVTEIIEALPRIVIDMVFVINRSKYERRIHAPVISDSITIMSPGIGVGAAIRSGVSWAEDYKTIVLVDPSDPTTVGELGKVILPVLEGITDLAVAKPVNPFDSEKSPSLSSRLLKRFGKVDISSVGTHRVLNRSAFKAMDLQEKGEGWMLEMLIKAAKMQLSIDEVAIDKFDSCYDLSGRIITPEKAHGLGVGSVVSSTLRYALRG